MLVKFIKNSYTSQLIYVFEEFDAPMHLLLETNRDLSVHFVMKYCYIMQFFDLFCQNHTIYGGNTAIVVYPFKATFSSFSS